MEKPGEPETSVVLIITLLTDFGTADYYVAAMKGVILSRVPDARLVDISHSIAPQNVLSAAYVMLGSCNEFPVGTVHLAVVDPGVGSTRRGVILRTDRYLFVGPDNGLFSLAARQSAQAFEIQASSYLPEAISDTFHGRDIFAPIAAALACGAKPEELGRPLLTPQSLPPLAQTSDSGIQSRIIHIDGFGNAVTGIERGHLGAERLPARFELRVGDHVVRVQKRFYAEEPSVASEPFAIWGSLNFLEVSVTDGSAAEALRLSHGQPVTLRFT